MKKTNKRTSLVAELSGGNARYGRSRSHIKGYSSTLPLIILFLFAASYFFLASSPVPARAADDDFGMDGAQQADSADGAVTGDEETGSDEEEAVRYYERATELHLAGYISQAVNFYKNAIFLDPSVAAYHADLGDAYRVTNNFREAISEFETAIKLNPGLTNAYTTLGVIYERELLPQLAIKYHRMAIKTDPRHFVSYNNLGHVYDTLGLKKAAADNYRKAISINPEFAAAYDNLGASLMQDGKAEEGAQMIQKAIDLTDPANPEIGLYYNDLGAAYIMLKKYPEAMDMFTKAIEMHPGNEDIVRNYNFMKDFMNGQNN